MSDIDSLGLWLASCRYVCDTTIIDDMQINEIRYANIMHPRLYIFIVYSLARLIDRQRYPDTFKFETLHEYIYL